MEQRFLPMTPAEMRERGWEELDFLFISGDAYVDHPSFGPAIICRILEDLGFRVGIIAQPNWNNLKSFARLGKPKFGVLVSGGNLDSMLSTFTAAKKRRSQDSYSPGGRSGKRPDRATIVYCQKIRELWGDIPIVIGGIEASLRRFAHYDYWSDSVRRSILVDSAADLLVYGMGEKAIEEIGLLLSRGVPISEICHVPGTCYLARERDDLWNYVEIPSYESVSTSRKKYAVAFRDFYREQDPLRGKTVVQAHGTGFVVQNPPPLPLGSEEMDRIYDLPYCRNYHPSYEEAGGVPAIEEVRFSIVTHRGCYGGCSFCALGSHQGRIIQSRSRESILKEARLITEMKDFKGYIHDVGGPTANFLQPSCQEQLERGTCRGRECLSPDLCRNVRVDHSEFLDLLREIRELPKVKKAFVRSGIRFDYLMADPDPTFLRELCQHHVSGQLKVAPEHVSPAVLRLMGKPGSEVYGDFMEAFREINEELGKKQYLVPYFISSHPGAGLQEAVELAEFIRDLGYYPEQVQDFIPTPGSLSTCMYHTGLNPLTGEKVYVARKPREKAMQRALMQYRNPRNYNLVYEALVQAGREDLIGFGPQCLIRPPRSGHHKASGGTRGSSSNRKNRTGRTH